MPDNPEHPLPGKGLFGWLGRQVGHVRSAVKRDVSPSPVLYRKTDVQEADHPQEPDLKLRRTTIDEVVRSSHPPADHS